MTSGSSLLTLGFERPAGLGSALVAFSEAAIGLGLLAVLIAYLPTIYGAFSRREVMVTQLSVRAGTPPTPWRAAAVSSSTTCSAVAQPRFFAAAKEAGVKIAINIGSFYPHVAPELLKAK